jgi:hypothetical protein
MTSALADLADNSIDAGATSIHVRFVLSGGRLTSLLVVDDGHGMNDQMIDSAMTIGQRSTYNKTALGHFGMGLKAASFSQADEMTVLSKRKGSGVVGRRWIRDTARSFACDVIDPAQVAETLSSVSPSREAGHGTVVRWDRVRGFPAANDPRVTDDYLSRTIQELRTHLGIVLHKLLARDQFTFSLDVFDVELDESGPAQSVDAIDPFGYRRSGDADFPIVLKAAVRGCELALTCHIWPARSELLGFRLDGNPERHQGFFFYRNDRLLQLGDWKGVAISHRRLQLARVCVDISPALDLFTMNMEKNAVQPKPEFARAVEQARADDGTTFADYLSRAENTYRIGNRRNTGRHEVVPPGTGLHPAVKRAIAGELVARSDREPVQIRWYDLPGDDLFHIDRPNQTLWLNNRYRRALLGNRRGSLNDLPLLKAALYLLTEDIFRGLAYGRRDRDNVDIWQAILTAAARVENDGT